jgi:hypothetical protein
MKTIKFFTLITALGMMLYSCSSETEDPALDAVSEAVNEVESFKLAESGFTVEGTESLAGAYDDMYTEGMLQYRKNGAVLATVEFGNGTDANMARLSMDGSVSDIALDRPHDGPHRHGCFRFVFPLTYIMPDGSTITGDSREEIHELFHAWYEAHPDVAERPELQFPVEIIFRHRDEPVTIENRMQLRRAFQSCRDLPGWDGHCDRRFIRRVVLPLVRTDDCGREPVAGIIKYFKCRTHEWVATIDFGEGQCDDLALKITADGVEEIVISEWFD